MGTIWALVGMGMGLWMDMYNLNGHQQWELMKRWAPEEGVPEETSESVHIG